jgi:hypothetical protein
VIAVLLLLAQATPAAMVTPEQADARCIAAFGAMGSNDKEEIRRAAQQGALYFYGKLIGRNPKVDLQAAMTAAATAVGKDFRPELTRCGGELERSGQAMQAAGQAMCGGTAPAASPKP